MKCQTELENIALDAFKSYLELFPQMGVQYGFTEYDFQVKYPKKEEVVRLINTLESYKRKCKSVSASSEEEKIDQGSLEFVIDFMLFNLKVPRYNEVNMDPAFLLLKSVADIMHLERISEKDKLDRVLSRLNQSDSVFENVKGTWISYDDMALQDSVSQSENISNNLESLLKPLVDIFPESRDMIQGLVHVIIQNEKDFVYQLKENFDLVKKKNRSIGARNLEYLLEVKKEKHSYLEILEIGEKVLEEQKEKLRLLAKTLSPENDSIEASLAKIEAKGIKHSFEKQYRDANQRIYSFIKEKKLLELPEEPIEVTEAPSWDPTWEEGMIGFEAVEILSEKPSLKIITVPPVTEKGKSQINPYSILLLIGHEGWAGHGSSFLLRKLRGRMLRTLLTSWSGLDDRWAFYWEEFLKENGIENTVEYEYYYEYRVFWCSIRHICDIKFHSGMISFDECLDMLEKQGHVSHNTAKGYAKDIANLPGYFSSFILGKQDLVKLREKTREQLGEKYSSAEFHRWVGEAGPLPFTLLEREIQTKINNLQG